MFAKVQLIVQINVQMFLKLYLLNRVIIKVQWRVWCLLYLARKNNFLRLFVAVRVESHFPLTCRSIFLLKSLFKLVADTFLLSTTGKSEISSAKSRTFVVRPSERSFIYIKNNNGPRIDPCGTPDSILDSWPFETTLCFLSFKKSVRVLKTFPDMPFCFNLKLRLWYGKTRVRTYELRVAGYELRVTSWKLESTSWNSKARVETQIHELRV